jgi:hypothetical protein
LLFAAGDAVRCSSDSVFFVHSLNKVVTLLLTTLSMSATVAGRELGSDSAPVESSISP